MGLLIIIGFLMIIGIISLVQYLNMEIVFTDSPRSYYVANDGDNSNDGLSSNTPWRTIGKVNSELNGGCINAGDDIYFNRGDTFSDSNRINIYLGGTSSNWMIFGAYGSGAKPILRNSGTSDVFFCDVAIGYVRFENFDINNTGGRGFFFYNNANVQHHFTWHDIDIHGTGGSAIGSFYSVIDFKIEDCTIYPDSSSYHGISIQYNANSATQCGNGIIRNCTIGNNNNPSWDCKDGISLHFGGTNENNALGDNFWIENCVISNTYEEPIDVVGGIGSENYLIQNTVIRNCRYSLHIGHGTTKVTLDNVAVSGMSSNAIGLTTTHNTRVRNSVLYSWGATKNGLCKSNNQYAPYSTTDISVYNNDFISDGDPDHMQINDANVDDWSVKNNIFYSTQQSSPGIFIHLIGSTFSGIGSSWTNNMWWRGDGLTGSHWADSGGTYNWAQWLALSTTDNDLRDDPEFINVAGGDYRLSDTSPCIDAGDWLTTTNGGGTGTTITVHDANYFCDGYGLTYGDNIFVGDDTDLEVTSVNYDTNRITVSRSIAWSDNDPVSLRYSGNAPDIGAKESAGTAEWSNSAPTLSNEGPEDTSTGISRYPQLNIKVTDADGNNSEVYWYTNASGSWYLMQTNSSVLNATVRLMNFTSASSYYTKYWWRISADDTHDNTTETYYFTTEPNTEDELTSPTNLVASNPTTSRISLEWNKGYIGGTLVHDLLYVDNFAKYGGNPLFDTSDTGDWSDIGVRENALLTNSTGRIVMVDGKYVMYFNGRTSPPNKFTRIGRATSTDGENWDVADDHVFNDTTANYYTFVGSVIQRGENDYIMYYGAKNDADQHTFKYATSADSITWTAQNVILNETDFTDVISINIPYVIYFDDEWHMIFEGDTVSGGGFKIFYASSSDGESWSAEADAIYAGGADGEWDDEDAANPSLYRLDTDKYVIFYNGNGNPTSYNFDLGVLHSTSITSGWTSWKNNPILTRGADGEWDDTRLEGPRLYMDDMGNATLRMWYFGLPATNSFADGAIGYAICDETITNTMVRYSTSNNLTTYTDGTLGYNGTDSYTTITGLNPDTTYYIRVWSWNETEGWNATGSNTVNENTLNPPNSPVITDINLIESDPLDTNPSFGWINITCDVTDDIAVDEVSLSITNPDGSYNNVFMNAGAGDSYYYNSSTAISTYGNYSYLILANGTNGNSSTSTVYDFSMPPNWDINKDGQCTVLDLALISNHYGETGQNGWIREDIDNNGIVQVLDFMMVTGHYGESWWT